MILMVNVANRRGMSMISNVSDPSLYVSKPTRRVGDFNLAKSSGVLARTFVSKPNASGFNRFARRSQARQKLFRFGNKLCEGRAVGSHRIARLVYAAAIVPTRCRRAPSPVLKRSSPGFQ